MSSDDRKRQLNDMHRQTAVKVEKIIQTIYLLKIILLDDKKKIAVKNIFKIIWKFKMDNIIYMI